MWHRWRPNLGGGGNKAEVVARSQPDPRALVWNGPRPPAWKLTRARALSNSFPAGSPGPGPGLTLRPGPGTYELSQARGSITHAKSEGSEQTWLCSAVSQENPLLGALNLALKLSALHLSVSSWGGGGLQSSACVGGCAGPEVESVPASQLDAPSSQDSPFGRWVPSSPQHTPHPHSRAGRYLL